MTMKSTTTLLPTALSTESCLDRGLMAYSWENKEMKEGLTRVLVYTLPIIWVLGNAALLYGCYTMIPFFKHGFCALPPFRAETGFLGIPAESINTWGAIGHEASCHVVLAWEGWFKLGLMPLRALLGWWGAPRI